MKPRPLIVTGQQIGAGWSPALSVVKALAALAEARRTGGDAVYWMADEDHDRAEVAAVVGFHQGRWHRHRFSFAAPPGTATGWLPWTEAHQAEAEQLWGPLPRPTAPLLKSHVLALGQPLWDRGLRPYSPTDPAVREGIQADLERWRELDLEPLLLRQATQLEAEGAPLPLDPRGQSAWFSLDPRTGLRRRLEGGNPLPDGHWLSPGAALRPLMQSLLLPVTAVVLGPSEQAYWRLCEPLWERVGLRAPRIIPRPSATVLPPGLRLDASQLQRLRQAHWGDWGAWSGSLPSNRLATPEPDPTWPEALQRRFRRQLQQTHRQLRKLDRRLQREAVALRLGADPEALRQTLFPFDRPQERMIAGATWLRDEGLLDRLLARLDGRTPSIILETP